MGFLLLTSSWGAGGRWKRLLSNKACTHTHTGGGGAHLLPWTPQSMLHLGRLLAVLSVTEFSVHGHVSLSDPHGVPGNRGGGSSAARLEAGGRQSQGAGALRVPSRTRSLCAFSGPPGGQCRPLPPRSGSRRAAGPAPRPHAAAPSPAPPLASHSECGQIPSAFPAPSPAFPRASGGLLITSAGSLSLIPAPTGATTCHRLYWSQPKTRGLFVYLLPKKLSCAFMSVRSWFVLFTVLV